MKTDDPDDLSFAAEMAQLGVTPLDQLGGQKQRSQGRSKRGKGPQRNGGQRARGPAPSYKSGKKSAKSGTSARSQTDAHRPAAITTVELAELRARLKAAEAAERDWQAERAAWDRERAALAQQAESARAQLIAGWNKERNKMAERERDLRAQLERARAILAERQSLLDALRARGCADVPEAAALTRGLLDQRPEEFLAKVDMISVDAFAHFLDQRTALVADSVELAAGDSCVVIRVPAERCEITGGSDIQAGFHRFADACERVRARRVTIVGGSPAYRRQLQKLSAKAGGRPHLNLVSGTQRRTRKRADADMRNSDLIIIWGATELDHSVTSVYTSAPEKTVRVPHRGISRMLLQAAEELHRRR